MPKQSTIYRKKLYLCSKLIKEMAHRSLDQLDKKFSALLRKTPVFLFWR